MTREVPDKLIRIGEVCAAACSTTYADIVTGSKHQEPIQARMLAMWIASKLLPNESRRRIASAYGRRNNDVVLDAVRRVAALRAGNVAFRDKADNLYRMLEAELGREEPKVKQKDDAAVGSSADFSWGFSGFNTGSRGYFEEQNKRFAEAMLKAGVMPRMARE